MDSHQFSEWQEKFHIEQFKNLIPDFPSGEEEFCYQKDSPDMIVQMKNSK